MAHQCVIVIVCPCIPWMAVSFRAFASFAPFLLWHRWLTHTTLPLLIFPNGSIFTQIRWDFESLTCWTPPPLLLPFSGLQDGWSDYQRGYGEHTYDSQSHTHTNHEGSRGEGRVGGVRCRSLTSWREMSAAVCVWIRAQEHHKFWWPSIIGLWPFWLGSVFDSGVPG